MKENNTMIIIIVNESGRRTVLESSTHTVRASRNGNHIGRVLNRDNNTSSQHEFFPGLSNVEDVNTVNTTTPDVIRHHRIGVTSSGVHTGAQHHLDVFLLGLEDGGEVGESSSHGE